MKPKICKSCGETFTPSRPLQVACGWACAMHLARQRSVKAVAAAHRKNQREAKEKLKTRRDHIRDAQRDFNSLIRARDHGFPCISCGRTEAEIQSQAVGGAWDAGHYRSVGSCPELRFEPLNCHKQCKRCNRDRSGNTVEYRIRLIDRIGADKVAWLEGPHETKKYTVDDLKMMAKEWRAQTRELRRQ